MTTRLSTDEVVLREGRALLGFMPEEVAKGFVLSATANDWEAIRPVWERARRACLDAGPGLLDAEPHAIEPLGLEVAGHLSELTNSPAFQAAFGTTPVDFGLVDIDSVVAFQQFVDTEFSEASAARIRDPHDPLAVVEIALPVESNSTLGVSYNPTDKSITLSSLDRSVLVGGMQVVQPPGQPIAVVFSIVTPGNWIHVVRFRDRLFLRNGYHRSWLLRTLGLKVPALITEANSIEEVVAGPGFFSPTTILADRPPRFGHFGDDSLAVPVTLKSSLKIVRISAEEFVVPRMP